jgi:hypothetical protein
MHALGISEKALKAKISCVFGDDSLRSDRELLEIAPYPYVIKNENRRSLNLPHRMRLVTWSEVEATCVSRIHSAKMERCDVTPEMIASDK